MVILPINHQTFHVLHLKMILSFFISFCISSLFKKLFQLVIINNYLYNQFYILYILYIWIIKKNILNIN